MKALRQAAGAVVAAAVLLAIGFALYAFVRSRPQDVPWAPLDLGQPVGMFTRAKLVDLRADFDRCQALLDRAGVPHTALAPVSAGQCGYDDGVRFKAGGARTIAYSPANLGVSCPVAAALAMWEWNVVQPAAQRHFGARVTRIDHLGSYNCRRLYGRDTGDYSQHATANAVDVSGFRIAGGERVSVLDDWDDDGAKGSFLREVRDGGCGLFATVLSPDYNAAHADHFHLDQADRSGMAWGACR